MPIEKSAGAVVYYKAKENLYLLLYYDAGHWGFPKGNIEDDEDMEETVAREIKEETGISRIKFISDFKEKISYFYKREGKTIYKEVVFYLVESEEKTVTLSDEHQGYEWLPYKEAMEKVSFDNDRNVLEKVHNLLRKT